MKFKKKRNRELILGKISEIKRQGSTRTLDRSFDWAAICAGAIELPPNTEYKWLLAAVNITIYSGKLGSEFSEREFLGEVSQNLERYRHRDQKKFMFLFSFTGLSSPVLYKSQGKLSSCQYFPSVKRKEIRRAFAEREVLSKRELEVFPENRFKISSDVNQSIVAATALGVDHFDAYKAATDLLDLDRGILNFTFNRRIRRFYSSPPRPVNAVLEKPFTTVHTQDGSLASDDFWYQPDWTLARIPLVDEAKYDWWKVEVKRVKKALKQNPLKDRASELLRQYCRVFDATKYRDSFLRAWALLENLTGASGNYDVLIERATKFWRQDSEIKEVLRYLREMRNDLTHNSSQNDEVDEEILYYVKDIVGPIINMYIYNPFAFSSAEELFDFLDLSASKAVLKQRKALIESAIKYRS